jgi:hypothetical protein
MPAITLDAGDPDFEKAERGKYLAQVACSYCHTPAYEPDAGWDPEDIVNQYTYVDHEAANCGSDQDGAIIYSSWWPGSALYGPAFPDEIHAQNITGHMTFGVGDYTIDELIRSVNGTDKENELMCPPMYVDTWFAEMTAEDKEAIAIYLQNSAPCDNDTEGMGFDCRLPE